MIKVNKTTATLVAWLLFTYNVFAQTYFSKRLDVANLPNASTKFLLLNDTFYIPAFVFETNGYYSVSLLKVDITGNIITQKRFHPTNVNFSGGNDLYTRNNKFYVPSVTDFSLKLQAGFYVFDNNCDTLFTKSYGDTTFYNLGNRILPYKRTTDKLLVFGVTDSTCGTGHPGLYKPVIRVVDTNGVLYQTKMYLTTCKYRNFCNVDTTKDKGYIISYAQAEATYGGRSYLLKLDSSLNLVWNKMYDTSSTNVAGIATLKSGKHILANTHVDSTYNSFYWDKVTLTKLDENGNIIWRKFYGLNNQGIGAASVKELPNGDFIICGERQILYSLSVGQLVGFLMRTDSSGNLKWWRNYYPTSPVKDTAGDCYLYDVLLMPDGGFAALGWAGGSGIVNKQQTWLLRVDSMGCLTPGCNNSTGIISVNNQKLQFKVYPNPTDGEIFINYNTPTNATLNITDINGKTLSSFSLKKNETTLKLDLSRLENGIYFYTIIIPDALPESGKIVIIK